MSSKHEAGDQVAVRYLWDGRITHGRPMTVVADTDDVVALYLAPGTRCKSCTVPASNEAWVATLLAGSWSLSDHTWLHNRVLMLIRPDEWFSVWGLWSDMGEPRSWYVNFEVPMVRSPVGFDGKDLQLDIVIGLDGSWSWKDEAEYVEMIDLGLITPEEEARVAAASDDVIQMLESGDHWWLEWRHWAPDPAWAIPELREGWDRVG
jgi:hypothetical protein